MAGLQGAGKTTTTAKLAKHLIEKRKKKVLTVSADVYRPAAIEQLKLVTKQAGAEWFASSGDDKPLAIALAALDYARKHYIDVLLVDTAGRLGIDEALMREISELHAALKPVETLFVVDAMQGQDAINTAKAFKEALPLTGIVLTKMDGDSRGGAALSVRQITGAPIKFAGISEKIDGLEVFDAERHRLAARREREAPDRDLAPGFPGAGFGRADRGDLRPAIDARGHVAVVDRPRALAGDRLGGDYAFRHGLMGQQRCACHVPDSVEPLHRGLHRRRHLDESALELHAEAFEPEPRHLRGAAVGQYPRLFRPAISSRNGRRSPPDERDRTTRA